MSKQQEQWKPVVGLEGAFEVSSLGRVRSRWKLLKPQPTPSGHLKHRLVHNHKGHQRYVHAMVLEAFVGTRPDGQQLSPPRR